ncbi:MAG: elongation factor G [Oscillospiraceae bacterium]|nr:elongation factor G [Oscillospiraceae bacterium]
MKAFKATNIRNICLAGHGGRGKTTLAEAMLYLAKATDRLGRVAAGTTVMDYDAEEKRRVASVSMSVAPLVWGDTKINLIDTPGMFDFAGGMAEGMRAAEAALIVTAPNGLYDVGASKAFKAAQKRSLGVMFAISRCDGENIAFYKTFDALKEVHGNQLCPVVVPFIEDSHVTCYVDFSVGKAFKYDNGKATEVPIPEGGRIAEMRDIFMESVASADEELLMRFFDGETFTQEEIAKGLEEGVAAGNIYPVYACSGHNLDAVDLLLNGVVECIPSADEKAGEGDISCDENGNLAAICFKTIADPFVGKMSFFKVVRGKITPDVPGYNARTCESERLGKIITVTGQKQEDMHEIPAGDIGVVTKLAGFHTGDTLTDPKEPVVLEGLDFPAPCISMAVLVSKKGEEEKVASSIHRLLEEDPTISFFINAETREQVLSGLGEQHLDVIVSKLRNKFGVQITLKVPKVAYRETIRKKVEAQGRHKKQSGGHGQFGDVHIRFEPCDEDFIFEEEIVGGSVPRQYFPAVEKGLRECITEGFLAGYPIVGLKAVLYFGSYHPVDSSEMAFKVAAHVAFRNAMPNAQPTILEPIGTLHALMPDENLGDIMGDITKRRGRVLGMGAADEPGLQQLDAEVPLAEMGDFSTALRSVTAGRGSFSLEFSRYEDAPANVAQKVIEDAKAEKAKEE